MIKKLIAALIIAFIYPPINNINHRGIKTDFHYDFIWNTNKYQLIDYSFWISEILLILTIYFILNYNEGKNNKYQATQIDEDIYELIAGELEGNIKKSTWTKACELSESNNFDVVKINYIKLRKKELLAESNSEYNKNIGIKNRINNDVIKDSVSVESKPQRKFSGFSFIMGFIGFVLGINNSISAGIILGVFLFFFSHSFGILIKLTRRINNKKPTN